MKKIIIGILTISLTFSGCQSRLEDAFFNPEKYDKTGNLFGGMFAKTLFTWKIYVQDYGEWWWEIAGSGAMGVSSYSQIAHRYITDRYAWYVDYDDLSGTNGFGSATALWDGRLKAFYTGVNTWAVTRDNLTAVTGQELDDNYIYYLLLTVIKDYVALNTVDFYNSIPYSEAFKGSERIFFPKYDDPKEIYLTILDELKAIAEELPAAHSKMTASAVATFNNQDIAFRGDLEKWIQYINAIRLKYALRISGVEESIARTHIQDVLSKNNLPTVDMVWSMPYDIDVFSGGEWLRGLNEAWPGTFVTDIIMRRMNYGTSLYEPGVDDPRLPVIAFPTKYSNFEEAIGDYRGVSMNADGQKAGYDAGETYYTGGPTGSVQEHFNQNSRSLYNFTTYTMNSKFPVYMLSMAEVDLLLAEIAEKGLGNTGKTPAEHLKDALHNSTDFWYARNAESPFETSRRILHPTKPDDGVTDTYANALAAKYNSKTNLDDKMEIIMQQKYIHLNLMCPYELWAEIRRTRHPKLEPFTFQREVMKPFPERLRYPISEQQNNPDNYATVRDQDNFTSPIFWVPENLRNVVPYWDNYDYE